MIARLWHGWTSPENAEPYERFLREQMFPSMRRVPGFLGAELLRRDAGDEIAFVTITRFESYDAVRTSNCRTMLLVTPLVFWRRVIP